MWELLKAVSSFVNKNYIGGFGPKREKDQKGRRRDIVRARARQAAHRGKLLDTYPYRNTQSQ